MAGTRIHGLFRRISELIFTTQRKTKATQHENSVHIHLSIALDSFVAFVAFYLEITEFSNSDPNDPRWGRLETTSGWQAVVQPAENVRQSYF